MKNIVFRFLLFLMCVMMVHGCMIERELYIREAVHVRLVKFEHLDNNITGPYTKLLWEDKNGIKYGQRVPGHIPYTLGTHKVLSIIE